MSESAYWKRRNLPVRPTQRESDLQRTILEYLEHRHILHYRQNSGVMKAGRRYIRFGYPGAPDIIAVIGGKYVGIEVKDGDEQQSEKQVEFQRKLEKAGGFYILARKLEDVIEVLEAPRK